MQRVEECFGSAFPDMLIDLPRNPLVGRGMGKEYSKFFLSAKRFTRELYSALTIARSQRRK